MESPEQPLPDLVAPIIGLRVWYVGADGSLFSLRSMYSKPPLAWPPGLPLTAVCSRHFSELAAPQLHCACGIYAAKRECPSLLYEYLPWRSSKVLHTPVAVGEVSLWGEVVEDRYGFRAERAYPRRIWLASDGNHSEFALAQMFLSAAGERVRYPSSFDAGAVSVQIAERYGVPAETRTISEIQELIDAEHDPTVSPKLILDDEGSTELVRRYEAAKGWQERELLAESYGVSSLGALYNIYSRSLKRLAVRRERS